MSNGELLTPRMNYDSLLMNAVYLSEKWAYEDLLRFKTKLPALWNDEREDQLQDELKHTKACLAALSESHTPIIDDIKFSMQERLYAQFYDFKESTTLEDLARIHNVFEKRALWVFRTYQKVGSNEKFKLIYRNIMKDEYRHNDQLKSLHKNNKDTDLQKADYMVWRRALPARFGPGMFSSEVLWKWYYGTDSL